MNQMLRSIVCVWLLLTPLLLRAASNPDVPYVPTPWNVVDAMFKLGEVGASDYLIDLGSGDGRIVITAAKRFGTRGMGVDLDDNLVRIARREAERQGVKDRTTFIAENLFFTDISKASVISMYLLPAVNLRLRPELFKLKPGTRIVSHDFDMGNWQPDQKLTIPVPEKSYGPPSSDIFLWVVPADASGRWRWQLPAATGTEAGYEATLEQTFQILQGNAQWGATGAQRAVVSNARVRGENVSFTLTGDVNGKPLRQEYIGRIVGESIEGHVTIGGAGGAASNRYEWKAVRSGGRGKMQINAGGGERQTYAGLSMTKVAK